MREREYTVPPPIDMHQKMIEVRIHRKRAQKRREAERKRNQRIFLVLGIAVVIVFVICVVQIVTFVSMMIGKAQSDTQQKPTLSKLPSISWKMPAFATGADVTAYDPVTYDLSGYIYNASDPRLVLVNANLPLSDAYTVETVVADDTTASMLASEAAEQYRAMTQKAKAFGISLVLTAGYQDAIAQQTLFDDCVKAYQKEHYSEAEAIAFAEDVVGAVGTSDLQTGYGAVILAEDYDTQDLGFADTEAFAWLSRYAAEYGFILRYPEAQQMITGRAYEPWAWRYVGVENAKAIVQSGLSLEEFIECDGVPQM